MWAKILAEKSNQQRIIRLKNKYPPARLVDIYYENKILYHIKP